MTPHDLATARPIADFLASLALAPRQSHKLLTVWPLLALGGAPASRAPAYVTLSEALEQGALVVDEVSEHGQVPHVLLENRGGVAVLVLFGEEIRGAKQNRVANASFLVAPKSRVVIDVSCVEHGRWSRSGGVKFRATGDVLSHSIRRMMSSRVALSRDLGGDFSADQHEVWDEVGRRVRFSGAESRTGAYEDYLFSRATDLDEVGAAFHPVNGQVGFVAAISDEIVGIEAIGRSEVFARAFPGLLRAYAIDAIDAPLARGDAKRSAGAPRFDTPEALLDALRLARATAGPSLGLGSDLRIEDRGVRGCALVAEDVVHATAFPQA